ncbi:MAG TPA: MBG domain-containing protein, partial [Flavobacteriales bacterium]|nr:MBG domain-containing protein [Flavobacteriales bacterium]
RGVALVNGDLIDPSELYNATAFANTVARSVRGTALVNAYTLVRGTALVNTLDTLGNVTNTTSLTNSSSLVNNSGLLNSSTITQDNNAKTIVILGTGDIKILSGDSTGNVTIRSMNLITGNTVGTHRSLPGTFLSNNFKVNYGIGHITILPAPAQFSIAPSSLTQTYNGSPKSVTVTTTPAGVATTVTYNGSATLPVNAGSYAVSITSGDPNYTGSTSATLVIQKATATVTIGSLTQAYNGSPKPVTITTVPAALASTVTYNGSATAPTNVGTYAVVATVNDVNYTGTASASLVIQKATAQITIGSLTQVYNATPRSVSVTIVPAGTAYTVKYNGSSTVP